METWKYGNQNKEGNMGNYLDLHLVKLRNVTKYYSRWENNHHAIPIAKKPIFEELSCNTPKDRVNGSPEYCLLRIFDRILFPAFNTFDYISKKISMTKMFSETLVMPKIVFFRSPLQGKLSENSMQTPTRYQSTQTNITWGGPSYLGNH